jgi:hypothetical protein
MTTKEKAMAISDYDGKKAAVASIQSQLNEQLDAIRRNRSYSDAGRKTEMAKAVLAARAHVDKMKSDFVAERKTRSQNLYRIVFGNFSGGEASEVIAHRDAQDRAARIPGPEDAKAMLHRANQNGDDSLARAVAEAAFRRGWLEVSQDYADQAGKRSALDLLMETNSGPRTTLADSVVFRVRNPEELGTATEPTLRDLAQVHAPGMEPAN